MFFSITRLVPFSRDDPLVVGQVEGGGLHAAVAVAGREDVVHDADGGQAAELRVAQGRVDGQVVLESCSSAEKRASFAVSASSRTVTKASKAALSLNQPSS